jgi:hypothetical protein
LLSHCRYSEPRLVTQGWAHWISAT